MSIPAGSSRVFPFTLLLLAVAVLNGCRESPPRLLAPEPDSERPSVLSIWADDLHVAEITDPEIIERIAWRFPVPPRNPEHLLEMGSFSTSDRGFITAVQEILAEKQAIGFSNPSRMSWGRIKLLARR